jgi:HNH endonuclease
MMLQRGNYHVGEMAQVIAHKPDGPRGRVGGGTDDYDNLILLCPTCHRTIDKAPEGEYTEPMLLRWKVDHEEKIRSKGTAVIFGSFDDLRKMVARKLKENRRLWEAVGPQSAAADADPGSNLASVWGLRKLDTIIPNNNFIINCIGNNENLLQGATYDKFLEFKIHAVAFERNQYGRLDSYPLFPRGFAEAFSDV